MEAIKPESLVEVAHDMERKVAEFVTKPVSDALAANYVSDELSALYKTLEQIHRKRKIRFFFREARVAGKNAEESLLIAGEKSTCSASYARQVVYGTP